MTLVQIVIATLALFGHLALWLAVFNRLHALGLPPWQVAVAEKPVLVWLVGVPAALVIGFAQAPDQGRFWLAALLASPSVPVYFWLCFGFALPILCVWIGRAVRREPAPWIGFTSGACTWPDNWGTGPAETRPAASWRGCL